MIYENSEERKYIFVHNPRTGGTNLTHFLNAYTNAEKYVVPDGMNSYRMHLTITWCDLDLDDFYTFGLVRNPFDREYSLYTLFKARQNENTKQYESFKHWIMDGFYVEPGHRYYGSHRYRSPQCSLFNEKCHVFKFENRTEALAEIAKNINVDVDTFVNYRGEVNSYKTNKIDYRNQYDQEMIDVVTPYFKKDLKKYGYSFE